MLEGGCRCGRVRYRAEGPPFHATICHCADCRHAAGAPMVAWFSVRAEEFRFVVGAPTRFASSEGVERSFCPACGTPLTYQSHEFPDEIDVTICSLDAPERVVPRDHTWTSARLPWVRLADGLPQFGRTRREG